MGRSGVREAGGEQGGWVKWFGSQVSVWVQAGSECFAASRNGENVGEGGQGSD